MTIDIGAFLDAYAMKPGLLALGEPTHGEPAFPQLRNDLFEALVKRGFRSIALESDRVAGLIADAYVRGEDVSLEDAFSHGLGELPSTRDLMVFMREHNAAHPTDRLTFYGFDGPYEMTSAPSPRPYLKYAHDFLGRGQARWTEIDTLLGPDERWSDTAALMNHEKSIGHTPDASRLREIADEMLASLRSREARDAAGRESVQPHLDRDRAQVNLDTAIGLLRYHALAAEPLPQTIRTSRLLGERDAIMANNLMAIRKLESGRGPTLVFAHNRHLLRNPSKWELAGMNLEWASAGSLVGEQLADRYVVIVGSLGASPTLGIPPAPPETIEDLLPYGLSRATDAPTATNRPAHSGYFPLDAETLNDADAVLHIPTGLTATTIAELIRSHPDVDELIASEQTDAPEGAWGDRFFYVGPDRRQPFATIVEHDVPGFDEDSQLNRPGVYRLNVELGRTEFERQFGFPPKDFDAHRDDYDFARADRLMPHPGYALYGWASIVTPGPQMLDEINRLITHARARAADRHERSLRRQPPPPRTD
jgi:erythromycin esterase-like protein